MSEDRNLLAPDSSATQIADVSPDLKSPLFPSTTPPQQALAPTGARTSTLTVSPGQGGGWSPGQGGGYVSGPGDDPTRLYPYLAQQRARFKEELDRNPGLKRQLAAIIHAENPTAGIAVAESLFNRMAMTGGSVASGIGMGNPKSFYDPVRKGHVEGVLAGLNQQTLAQRMDQIDRALAGSNTTLGHTDQGSKGGPNYDMGGVGVNWNGERFNDWGGDPNSVAKARMWRINQQAQLGPEYAKAAEGFKSGMAPIRPPPQSGMEVTHALSLPYGPQETEQTAAQAPTLPPSKPPEEMGISGLMALALGMAAGKHQVAPVSYDPWAVQQKGKLDTSVPGSLGLQGYSVPRIGSKVGGPAPY